VSLAVSKKGGVKYQIEAGAFGQAKTRIRKHGKYDWLVWICLIKEAPSKSR
jgi:hypothetical protein